MIYAGFPFLGLEDSHIPTFVASYYCIQVPSMFGQVIPKRVDVCSGRVGVRVFFRWMEKMSDIGLTQIWPMTAPLMSIGDKTDGQHFASCQPTFWEVLEIKPLGHHTDRGNVAKLKVHSIHVPERPQWRSHLSKPSS